MATHSSTLAWKIPWILESDAIEHKHISDQDSTFPLQRDISLIPGLGPKILCATWYRQKNRVRNSRYV